jgi:hypothetical protein
MASSLDFCKAPLKKSSAMIFSANTRARGALDRLLSVFAINLRYFENESGDFMQCVDQNPQIVCEWRFRASTSVGKRLLTWNTTALYVKAS